MSERTINETTNKSDHGDKFLKADHLQFQKIAKLKGEDWTVARRLQLAKYSKPDLNLLLTVYTGGLTSENLKTASESSIVEKILIEEIKRASAGELKKEPKAKKHGAAKKRQPAMDEKQRREWFKEIQDMVVKHYSSKENPVKVRLSGGKPVIFSVKVNGRAVAIKPLTNKEISLETRVSKSEQFAKVIPFMLKAFKEFFAEAKVKQDKANPPKERKVKEPAKKGKIPTKDIKKAVKKTKKSN